MVRWWRWWAGVVMWCGAAAVQAMSVVFINPGRADEAYWVAAAEAMQSAARSLGVRFENRHAERDHRRAVALARELVERPANQRPDYVVFSNDYGTGPEMLRILDGAGIKTFLAFSGISDPRDRELVGRPRQRHKGWLGSLEPRAEDAGYLTAQALIAAGRAARAQAADGRLHLLALAGDRSTPSSVRRNAGLQRAVAEAADVVLVQQVYSGWLREKAAQQASWLYQRHPGARLIWAGSDQVAFGAMQAWEARGGKPGQDAWFSAINTSGEAMHKLMDGRLAALAGGHFTVGAWALVMLYDFHHGRDFADDGGLEADRPLFVAFDQASALRFQQRFGAGFPALDWRRHSKVLNRERSRYDLRFSALLEP